MQIIAQLLIGFSVFTALLLYINALFQPFERSSLLGKQAGEILIIFLTLIQIFNLKFIMGLSEHVFSGFYIFILYCIAPSFYFYSRQILTTQIQLSPWYILHIIPIFISPVIPKVYAIPLAFLLGSGYLLWLARSVYLLRQQRQRFKLELLALAVFFVIAICVILLGFIWPLLSSQDFIISYSILIGLVFFTILLTLLRFPSIKADVIEAVQASYAESTLNNIDRNAILKRLVHLMEQEKVYTQESLSLSVLAEQLDLNTHQLSELINTEFQQGFSKYIRYYRIEAAKILLLDEPKSSVLSIGLSVGFSTQSNFYTAFREMVGMAPGQYRKKKMTS